MFSNRKSGFTLIELLVVIAIIGVLSTMAIIALGNARAKARDSKRVADIKQISTALELYYSDYNSYPTIITPGNSLASPDGTKVYMAAIPNNPTPRNDNGCGDNNYTYASTPDNSNYSLNFCLGNNVSSTPAGINSTSNSGVGTAPGLVGWWKFDEGVGSSKVKDYSGGGKDGTWYGTGSHYAPGKVGSYAGSFNGVDDYAYYFPAILTSNEITLSCWINVTGDIGGYYTYAVGYGGVGIQIFSHYYGSGDPIAGTFYTSGGYVQTSWTQFTKNSWHFVAITYSYNGSTASAKFYYDGALTGSGTGPNPGTVNPGTGSMATANSIYPGLIDDARMYNRALSAAEILALYNATK
ncbi:MAG: prepilin-type N-terminal cleavage/methylation domain-containing protein [Candidatus Falkowbacteria bacterium]|nr:prepilin-type N-terminal cleavage/methylation domain-containing protein [Candidatus Falkowbacteria bacterium]